MSKIDFDNPYKYKTKEICKALGITRMTLYLWEQKGRFTAPRTMEGARVVTEKQLKQIVKAFSPGGKGEWHFNPEEETSETILTV